MHLHSVEAANLPCKTHVCAHTHLRRTHARNHIITDTDTHRHRHTDTNILFGSLLDMAFSSNPVSILERHISVFSLFNF